MILYEVTAEYTAPRDHSSRHTQYTSESAARMAKVHRNSRERGETVDDIAITRSDVDPSQLVFVVEPGTRITRCPTSYAADTETLELEPGEYPLFATTVDGRTATWDKPYYINATVPAKRIDGRTYSGIAGNNFASRELPLEPVSYHWSTYAYYLGHLIESGKIRVR